MTKIEVKSFYCQETFRAEPTIYVGGVTKTGQWPIFICSRLQPETLWCQRWRIKLACHFSALSHEALTSMINMRTVPVHSIEALLLWNRTYWQLSRKLRTYYVLCWVFLILFPSKELCGARTCSLFSYVPVKYVSLPSRSGRTRIRSCTCGARVHCSLTYLWSTYHFTPVPVEHVFSQQMHGLLRFHLVLLYLIRLEHRHFMFYSVWLQYRERFCNVLVVYALIAPPFHGTLASLPVRCTGCVPSFVVVESQWSEVVKIIN